MVTFRFPVLKFFSTGEATSRDCELLVVELFAELFLLVELLVIAFAFKTFVEVFVAEVLEEIFAVELIVEVFVELFVEVFCVEPFVEAFAVEVFFVVEVFVDAEDVILVGLDVDLFLFVNRTLRFHAFLLQIHV
jgi:hypothetical protein